MTRLPSRLLLATLLVVAVADVFPDAAFGQAAPVQPPAATTLARCINSANRVLVLLLVDESGSLDQTDPQGARVAGVKAALSGLARLASEQPGGRTVTVDVRIATFAQGYRALWDSEERNRAPVWRTLTADSLHGLQDEAEGLRDRHGGLDTDYGTALSNAKRDLAERAADVGGGNPCKALLFFTDGRYEIGDRVKGQRANLSNSVEYAPGVKLDRAGGGARAVDAGRHFLCDKGGLADQLRSDGVTTFTIALDRQLDSAADSFLDALTDGSAPDGSTCGSTGGVATGDYLPIGDANDLVFLFGSLFDAPVGIRFCPTPNAGPCKFLLPRGASGFLLTTAAPVDGGGIELTAPGGSSVMLQAGQSRNVDVGSARLNVRWLSSRSAEIDASVGSGNNDWVGTWQLVFVAPGGSALSEPAAYTVRITADLRPSLLSSREITVGRRADLDFGLVGPDGVEIGDSPLIRSAGIDAMVVAPLDRIQSSLVVSPVSPGRFRASYDVPKGLQSGEVDLVLTARIGVAEGVSVSTRQNIEKLRVLLPEEFPRIEPASLSLPAVTGTGETHGLVRLLAGVRSSGCVWVAPGVVVLADKSRTAAVPELQPGALDRGRCVHLAAGETKALALSVRAVKEASGRANGLLTFSVTSDKSAEVHTILVPMSFEMRPAPNTVFAWAAFILLFLAGLALPIILLLLLNRSSGKLAAPQHLRGNVLEVVVTANTLCTSEGKKPVAHFGDFNIMGDGRAVAGREMKLAADLTVHTRACGARHERLTLRPYAVADGGSGLVVLAGSDRPLTRFAGVGRHEVPPGLAGTWVFMTEEGQPVLRLDNAGMTRPVDGLLVLLIANGGDPHAGENLLADASYRLPAMLFEGTEGEKDADGGIRAGPRRQGRVEGWWRRSGRLFGRRRGNADSELGGPVEGIEEVHGPRIP